LPSLGGFWEYANGDTSIGFEPINAEYDEPGYYKIRHIAISSLNFCKDTAYHSLVVAPEPEASFSINLDSQCFRFNRFELKNTTNLKFCTMKCSWDWGDGSTDTGNIVSKSYTQENNYTIQLKVITNHLCVDTSDIPIGFYPGVVANFTVNDSAQCLNKHSFDFINTSYISNGSFTQKWSFDELDTENETHVLNKSFAKGGYHHVILSLLSDKGCKDSLTRLVYLEEDKHS